MPVSTPPTGARAEVKDALQSAESCTANTALTLRRLLFPEASTYRKDDGKIVRSRQNEGSQAATRQSRTTKRVAKAVPISEQPVKVDEDQGGSLGARDKTVLATEVVNIVLKTLGEVIKSSKPQESPRSHKNDSLKHLKDRSPNLVPSSPIKQSKSITKHKTSPTRDGPVALAECASLAFDHLQTDKSNRQQEWQLEQGMLAFVGKIIALGLEDIAVKELEKLRLRFSNKKSKESGLNPGADVMATLLDFGCLDYKEPALPLIVNYQLAVLKCVAISRRPKAIECLLQSLKSIPNKSPLTLLPKLATTPESTGRAARQLESMSQSLLAMCSSPKGTTKSGEAYRASLRPSTRLEIQMLALETRITWMKLAVHQVNGENELLGPFSKYVDAFLREATEISKGNYQCVSRIFEELGSFASLGKPPKSGPNAAETSAILKVHGQLSMIAQKAGLFGEAEAWVEKALAADAPALGPAALRCAFSVRLAGLSLKKLQIEADYKRTANLMSNALDLLGGTLHGTVSDIDLLIQNLVPLRKSALHLFLKHCGPEPEDSRSEIEPVQILCRNVLPAVVRTFRKCLSVLCKDECNQKHSLQHQRTEAISSLSRAAVESVLAICKTLPVLTDEDWDFANSALQDCVALLVQLECGPSQTSDAKPDTAGLMVAISNIYWQISSQTGSVPLTRKLDAQRLSCSVLSGLPQLEKDAGYQVYKLTKFSQTLKDLKRPARAIETLFQAVQEAVNAGTLTKAAAGARSSGLRQIWEEDGPALALGKTLKTLISWIAESDDHETPFFDEPTLNVEERALLLEWQLVAARQAMCRPGFDGSLRKGIASMADILLELYSAHSFPVRRRRVALEMLRVSSIHQNTFNDRLRDLIADGEITPTRFKMSKDEGLRRFSGHMEVSIEVCLAFQSVSSTTDLLIEALSKWVSMTSSTESIDDLDSWISQLWTMLDYFDMQGLESSRIDTLLLLTQALEMRGAQHQEEAAFALTKTGLEVLRLGYSAKAGLYLEKRHPDVLAPGLWNVQWHLAYAEYALCLGDYPRCDEHLIRAKEMFTANSGNNEVHVPRRRPELDVEARLVPADAQYVYSLYRLQSGRLDEALQDAKTCVKLLQRIWARFEGKAKCTEPRAAIKKKPSNSNVGAITESFEKMAIVQSGPDVSCQTKNAGALSGPSFWLLVPRLHRALSLASRICQQSGMYQEAVYFAQRAQKLAESAGSKALLARSLVDQGDYANYFGSLDQGKQYLEQAEHLQSQLQASRGLAVHHCSLGYFHHRQNHWSGEMNSYDHAGAVITRLTSPAFVHKLTGRASAGPDLKKTAVLEVQASSSSIHAAKPTKKVAAPSKSRPKKEEVKSKREDQSLTQLMDYPQLKKFEQDILRRKAESMLAQGKIDLAASTLSNLLSFQHDLEYTSRLKGARARQLLLDAMCKMSSNATFAMLSESTMSFPAILRKGRGPSIQHTGQVNQMTQRKRALSSASPQKKKSKQLPPNHNFAEMLSHAFDELYEVFAGNAACQSTISLHQISSLFVSASMLVSYTHPDGFKQNLHPGVLANAIDAPRNIASLRDQSTIKYDKLDGQGNPVDKWLNDVPTDEVNELSINTFQNHFVDIIPNSWTAISLSLSEQRDVLYIVRYQSGRQPFIVRLPLTRQNSHDVHDTGDETFTFADGNSELLQIIQESDLTVHKARDDPQALTVKGAKTKWWTSREELDQRLADLLLNIENIWLGGFRGILSQHSRPSELLARFQQTFANILQKHLPSRQRSGKQLPPKTEMDPQIYDLFVGLGDPADHDLDEPLNDLLFFIVDILQFHGEANAYDEVDFDAMICDTQDALRSYHEAARLMPEDLMPHHTILILDKKLHLFPWESLPCLQGHSVSRVPSLVDLRDRIKALNAQQKSTCQGEGIHASPHRGTYILNPSSDLSKTQSRFQAPLSNSPTTKPWTSIIGRPPSEPEVVAALSSTTPPSSPNPGILLYFGHGSGAQYIRSKTIKRLSPSCNTALLFGCSSVSLIDAGEFEPYGTPKTYMLAGAPAVLGSLWDVTDGDCDRFAGAVLERWGLLPEGSCELEAEARGRIRNGKGKGKAKASLQALATKSSREADMGRMSLNDAVARSRGDCYLRYLNGAAMVVYGVPVYVAAA